MTSGGADFSFSYAFDDFERIVLRLEPADVKDVVSSLETEALQHVAVVFFGKLGAVRNHDRLDAEVVAVIRGDDFCVGDDAIRKRRRERFARRIHEPSEEVPLAAAALDAVDVDDDRNSRGAQQRDRERVRRVAEQDDVEVATQRVDR